MKELRPYQSAAIDNIRATLRNGVKRMIVSGPCGFGKTLIAATIANGATSKGKRMVFCCPAISLIDQTVEAFYDEGCYDVGVLQGNHHMTNASRAVQICSIQTIASRGIFPPADIVVLDEIHTFFKAHERWLADPAFAKVPFIGLTATPFTKGLGKHFETLLIAATTQELIDLGYLSKFKVYATGHPDLSGVKMVAGDYHEGQLSDAMQSGSLTADIVRTYKERWNGPQTLCFCVDRQHAQTVQMRFEEAGFSCGYQDGETPADERREIKRKFYSGEFSVVTSIGTLTTGIDWPVRCIIFARPTKSRTLFVQCIGRGLRTATDKPYLLLLDHSDTTQNLGFVTDITVDRLDDGKKQEAKKAETKSKPLPRPCPQCASLTPRLVRMCPDCGFKLPLASGVTERDGVLVELVPGQANMQKGGKRKYRTADKRRFHAELLWYARDRDKSPKWVLAMYRAKFEEWPPRSWVFDEPMGTSFEVLSWIRARNIRFAKSQHRLQAAE